MTTIFLHITKTAGGTLKDVLRMSVPNAGKTIQFVNGKAIRQLQSGSDFVFGHLRFGVHEILGAEPNYIAFLRHPVTRVISHYYHLRNVDKSRIGNFIRETSDINAFFKKERHWEFENLMCRVLSGKLKEADDIEATYRLAQQNAKSSFAFVGFQEFFELSLRQLSRTLGFPLVVPNNAVNIGRYRLDEISDETLDAIAQSNRYDLAIYEEMLTQHLPLQMRGEQDRPPVPSPFGKVSLTARQSGR